MDVDAELQFLKKLSRKIRADLLEMYPADDGSDLLTRTWMMRLNNGRYRFFDEEYCGACAVASYMLFLGAGKKGLRLSLVSDLEHFWCEKKGLVIDPTFSQFSKKTKVYIGKRTLFHRKSEMEFPQKITKTPDGFWQGTQLVRKEGLYRGDNAIWNAWQFPTVQNPFGEFHKEKIQNWVHTLP